MANTCQKKFKDREFYFHSQFWRKQFIMVGTQVGEAYCQQCEVAAVCILEDQDPEAGLEAECTYNLHDPPLGA